MNADWPFSTHNLVTHVHPAFPSGHQPAWCRQVICESATMGAVLYGCNEWYRSKAELLSRLCWWLEGDITLCGRMYPSDVWGWPQYSEREDLWCWMSLFSTVLQTARQRCSSKRFLSRHTEDVFSLWIREVECHYVYKRQWTGWRGLEATTFSRKYSDFFLME